MPIILDGQEKYYQNVGPSLYEQYVAKHPQTDKPTYADSYSGQLGDLYNKINNRSPFSYDASKDPLYQSYKDQYIQGGKLAMKDTMGQAAALTGGYANTYGQQVARDDDEFHEDGYDDLTGGFAAVFGGKRFQEGEYHG